MDNAHLGFILKNNTTPLVRSRIVFGLSAYTAREHAQQIVPEQGIAR